MRILHQLINYIIVPVTLIILTGSPVIRDEEFQIFNPHIKSGDSTRYEPGKSGNDYPIQPVPFTSITLSDSFWLPRINTIHNVTIPHALDQSANRILNFKIAAGIEQGIFQSSYPFDDSDVYKIIEAASYSLYYNSDEALEKEIDTLISYIARAQESDGYLYTCRTIGSYPAGFPVSWLGSNRWDEVEDLSHELYNMGHLFEAACAYYQATGKENLLDIAVKAADLIYDTFGWEKLEKYPGHQVVELGLARLYRITGDSRYLDLARFFLDVRGPGGAEYCQAHLQVTDQTAAVGHAVRAVYMYSGMADIAAIMNEHAYITAIGEIWNDILTGKIYVTGGIGASGGNEGFNESYYLPNSSAYCETCASVGNIYFNHRLFLLHGDAKYIDVLERTLYNALLSGISVSGDRFFYPNRLESSGSENRSSWFGCACCPPNIARLIPSVPGYIYAQKSDTLYVNLFMSDTASFPLDGNDFRIIQETEYPWKGMVSIEVDPDISREYTLMIRIPGWARNEAIYGNIYSFKDNSDISASVKINGEDYSYVMHNGYAVLKRVWNTGDKILLELPMEPKKLIAHEQIKADRDKFAIQRGPFVYCAEGIDNTGTINAFKYDLDADLTTRFDSIIMNGIQLVSLRSKQIDGSAGDTVTLIPYSYWNNRGPSSMQVWLSEYKEISYPDSLILILNDDYATTNHVSSWETLSSIYDLYEPLSSSDKGPGAFGNWRYDGGTVGAWNWVQYNFEEEKTIGSSEVYWWRDGAGINIPDSTYLSYYDEDSGKFIRIESTLKGGDNVHADRYNKEIFYPVKTKKIRLNFYGISYAQGILEWKLYSPVNWTYSQVIYGSDIPVKIYPNPSENNVCIELGIIGQAEILIYKLTGELVYNHQFQERIFINVSDIGGAGIYIVGIKLNSNIVSRRIIIQ